MVPSILLKICPIFVHFVNKMFGASNKIVCPNRHLGFGVGFRVGVRDKFRNKFSTGELEVLPSLQSKLYT